MREPMWFVLGVLCGAVLGLCLRKKKIRGGVSRPPTARREPLQNWVETRNFLYYDGTQMPVIKENGNEQ